MVKSKGKTAQYLENWHRAEAELENLKKRTSKEKEAWWKQATSDLALNLLPVLDNFERALAHVPADQQNNNWLVGVTYIHKQLLDVLSQHDIIRIEIEVGEEFNEQTMNAVEKQETTDIEAGKVLSVISPAYKLKDEIIRPATVIVSAGPINN